MIWILTAVYYFFWSFFLVLGYMFYAKSLMFIGEKKLFLKGIIGMVVYLIFVCFIISPLLMASSVIDNCWDVVRTNDLYSVYFISLFILAQIPGGILIRGKYLGKLRKLGYFKKK